MKKLFASITFAAVALSFGAAAQAQPQPWDQRGPAPQRIQQGPPGHNMPNPDRRWHGGPSARDWDASRHYRTPTRYQRPRRMSRNDYVYRGNDGRYYCRRGDGTTGLVVGGVIGGVLGNAVGGDTLSTLIGVAGGAALGRAIDRGQVSCR